MIGKCIDNIMHEITVCMAAAAATTTRTTTTVAVL